MTVFVTKCDYFCMKVRLTGLEPARRKHQILSLARLPIPPQARFYPSSHKKAGAKVIIFIHSAKSFWHFHFIFPMICYFARTLILL